MLWTSGERPPRHSRFGVVCLNQHGTVKDQRHPAISSVVLDSEEVPKESLIFLRRLCTFLFFKKVSRLMLLGN